METPAERASDRARPDHDPATDCHGTDGTVAGVTLGEARAVLGVGAEASPTDLRAAFRRAMRDTHPDLHGGDGAATRRVTAAYRLLAGLGEASAPAPAAAAAAAPGPSADPPTPTTDPIVASVSVDGDTVSAELPAGDLFAMLVEVGHRIGEVTYVDSHAGLLEIVVQFEHHGSCSVVLTLQGGGAGITEAFCTVVALGAGPGPPTEAVASLLADGLRSLVA